MTASPGRPKLSIDMKEIMEALRRQDAGHFMRAAQDLAEAGKPCSDRHIRRKLAGAGLTLDQVLGAEDVETLLKGLEDGK